jgi:tRNA(Ile)-lysidine synthase
MAELEGLGSGARGSHFGPAAAKNAGGPKVGACGRRNEPLGAGPLAAADEMPLRAQKAMTAQEPPIRADELEALFGAWRANRGLALAVSGGSDSTALMVLLAEWLAQTRQSPTQVHVLIVDHGLRAHSRAEAETVAQWADQRKFRHAVLPWTGPKPTSGVQAAARAARYRLLAAYMRSAGLDLLMTAHTADDQAETLLMRLARGSGLDGLAAMAPLVPLDPPRAPGEAPMFLARPLLGLAKARLQAALEARGVGWLEDESNTAPIFERSKVRAARETLYKLGLTGESLALTARRLHRARAALDATVAQFCAADAGDYSVDPCGFIRIEAATFLRLPSELQLRVLARGIAAVGGSGMPVPLAKLEALAQTLVETAAQAAAQTTARGAARPVAATTWTLARASISWLPGAIVLEREPGRRPGSEITLPPGASALWDGRFWVAAGPELGAPIAVRAVGPTGLSLLRRQVQLPVRVPIRSLRALPGFWKEAVLVAVPSVNFLCDGTANRYGLSAIFAPLALTAGAGAGDRPPGA